MARPKAGAEEESRSKIFRRYYEKKPELLKVANFDEIAAMYKEEFPDREFTVSDRQIAANMKSKLRRQFNVRVKRLKRKKASPAVAAAPQPELARTVRAVVNLASLEEQIDDCLNLARKLDPETLVDVVKHLRRARNLVIIRAGE